MRQKNWRLITVGSGLIVLVIGFFLFMMGIAPQSNDPQALMTTVGQVSGVLVAISLVMIVFGFLGKKS